MQSFEEECDYTSLLKDIEYLNLEIRLLKSLQVDSSSLEKILIKQISLLKDLHPPFSYDLKTLNLPITQSTKADIPSKYTEWIKRDIITDISYNFNSLQILFKGYRDVENRMIKLAYKMILEEAKYEDEYYIFYHSYVHSSLLYDLNSALLFLVYHTSLQEPILRIFEKDFIKDIYELAAEATKEKDLSQSFAKLGVSAIWSLFSNPYRPLRTFYKGYHSSLGEVDYRNIMISTLKEVFAISTKEADKLTDQIIMAASEYGSHVRSYQGDSKSNLFLGGQGNILQIFIRKDIGEEMCYPTKTYGARINTSLKQFIGHYEHMKDSVRIMADPKEFIKRRAFSIQYTATEEMEKQRLKFMENLVKILSPYVDIDEMKSRIESKGLNLPTQREAYPASLPIGNYSKRHHLSSEVLDEMSQLPLELNSIIGTYAVDTEKYWRINPDKYPHEILREFRRKFGRGSISDFDKYSFFLHELRNNPSRFINRESFLNYVLRDALNFYKYIYNEDNAINDDYLIVKHEISELIPYIKELGDIPTELLKEHSEFVDTLSKEPSIMKMEYIPIFYSIGNTKAVDRLLNFFPLRSEHSKRELLLNSIPLVNDRSVFQHLLRNLMKYNTDPNLIIRSTLNDPLRWKLTEEFTVFPEHVYDPDAEKILKREFPELKSIKDVTIEDIERKGLSYELQEKTRNYPLILKYLYDKGMEEAFGIYLEKSDLPTFIIEQILQ